MIGRRLDGRDLIADLLGRRRGRLKHAWGGGIHSLAIGKVKTAGLACLQKAEAADYLYDNRPTVVVKTGVPPTNRTEE